MEIPRTAPFWIRFIRWVTNLCKWINITIKIMSRCFETYRPRPSMWKELHVLSRTALIVKRNENKKRNLAQGKQNLRVATLNGKLEFSVCSKVALITKWTECKAKPHCYITLQCTYRLHIKYPESGHHSNSTRITVLFLALIQSNFSTMVSLGAKESGHCSAVKGLF